MVVKRLNLMIFLMDGEDGSFLQVHTGIVQDSPSMLVYDSRSGWLLDGPWKRLSEHAMRLLEIDYQVQVDKARVRYQELLDQLENN